MTTVLAWLGVASGALVGAVVVMSLLGWWMPSRYVTSQSLLLPVPVAEVWASLVDYPGQTAWRRGLSAVDRLPDDGPTEVWRERFGRSATLSRTIEARSPAWLVRESAAEGEAVRRRWEFALEPVVTPSNTRITLTERGEIRNPLRRFVVRFITGRSRTLRNFLRDLAGRFNARPGFIPSVEAQRQVDAPPPLRDRLIRFLVEVRAGFRAFDDLRAVSFWVWVLTLSSIPTLGEPTHDVTQMDLLQTLIQRRQHRIEGPGLG